MVAGRLLAEIALFGVAVIEDEIKARIWTSMVL